MLRFVKLLTTGLRLYRPQLSNKLLTNNVFRFAQTSRDIEKKMRQQKAKSLQNQFKALETSFGLHMPKQISSDYPKPSTIEYTIESLRKYSHMYPEFLLKELKNKKCQFYEIIQKAFLGFQAVDNKQAIEFLEFMVVWKIYLHEQLYEQMLIRKIYQMDMTLNELFRVLQFVVKIQSQSGKVKIMGNIEQKILRHILDIDVHEYESLFKILNFMRVKDLYPKIRPETVEELKKQQEGQEEEEKPQINQDSFFKVVESVLLRNLDSIPIPNLVEMIVHYANNIKEEHEDAISILAKCEPKVLQNITFFNHDELIAIMFSYIKTNTHSQKLINEFVRRVQLLYFEISWSNKKRIINLAASLPHDKWMYIVGVSIFEVLKGKKVILTDGKKEVDPSAREVQLQLLPTIYLAAYQTNLATPELIDKLQPRILENIFNYSAEDIGLIAWLFTITPPSLQPNSENKRSLYEKIVLIMQGGFNQSTFTLKDISMVVWSLCNSGTNIYNQEGQFWKNIEFYVQDRLLNKKQELLFNSCCQILWAYGNNKPLTLKTINIIIDIIIQKESDNSLEEEMFVFELTTISSFFYSLRGGLPKSITTYMQNLSIKYFEQLIQEMSYLEIMKMLKYTIYDENDKLKQDNLSNKLWEKIINQFIFDLEKIDYASIMGVIGFTILSPQGKKAEPKTVQLVKKLMARKASLQQLRAAHPKAD